MIFSGKRLILSGILSTVLLGCGSLQTTTTPSGGHPGLLQTGGEFQRDMVGVDIFLIRITPQRRELLRQLWHEVDELPIPTALRRDLVEHGLRVGVQGSFLSPSLSQLINVTASPTGNEHAGLPGGMEEISVADIRSDAGVSRQYRNLMPGMRAVLRPFDQPIAELPFFWHENGRICGKTYHNAVGLIGLTARPQHNGTVRFELVPELEHGTMETRTRLQNMVVFQESGRPRRAFEELAVSLDLLPGQWIIIGPTSVDSLGVGRAFFVRGTDGDEQKIIAIRLVDVKKPVPSPGSSTPTPENGSNTTIPERN